MFEQLAKVKRLQLDIQLALFERLVIPVLLYDSGVWECEKVEQVEPFYRTFLKGSLNIS